MNVHKYIILSHSYKLYFISQSLESFDSF